MDNLDWSEANALCEQLTVGQMQLARKMISQLAEKWTLWTLAVLDAWDKPLRFSRVMEQVPGVSQKSLTKTLRQLEHDGLVKRSIFAEVPPRVEYEVTDLGREMLCQIYPLVNWTVTNIERLAAAQKTSEMERPPCCSAGKDECASEISARSQHEVVANSVPFEGFREIGLVLRKREIGPGLERRSRRS